ncbi:MAG: SDR family oxidoreductase [Actinobacteria bacterium]|nr:SDR family oxidoreductase [Cyanobacteriota bacterium]MCL5771143.1 SDR family oxidoreductase [Actinomycetota bacterium]
MRRLEGKVVIVTGGAQGIGEAYSIGMAKEGARVIIADLHEEFGLKLAEKINNEGNYAIFFKTDVSKKKDAYSLIDKALSEYDRVDVLINNAAILKSATIEETTEEMWDMQLAVNVKGVFFCSQAAAKAMVKQKSGKIINISSIAAVGAQPGLCVYSSTKGAVLTMTKVFALELCSSNIQVNAILPGTTDTGMAKQAMIDPKWTKQVIKSIPMGRLGKPNDLLGAVIYFASDDSNYCTGQTLIVDGGVSMI